MEKIYNNSLAENKVLILYIIKATQRELTCNDLFELISKINEINYFYFRDILGDLINSKLIATYSKEERQELMALTEDGKRSLELTIDILPGIVKLKADNILKEEINNIAEKQSILAEYIPENENDYMVKCKIVENNKTIFEVQTFAGSNEQAKRIADNWKNHAYEIYPKIIDLLNFS